MDPKTHWQAVYESKRPTDVSWYRPHLEISLDLIRTSGVDFDGKIIDVGGGASTLVDDLLTAGYKNLTVLDVSDAALDCARHRLKERASAVTWIAGDVTKTQFPENYFDIWHDRAVFHFLTGKTDREKYIAQARHALRPSGHLIIATFGPEGPEKCSGLDVVKYSAEKLADTFGAGFTLLDSRLEDHATPGGKVQQFLYCVFQHRTQEPFHADMP